MSPFRLPSPKASNLHILCFTSLYHEISHQPKLPVSSITSLRDRAVHADILTTATRVLTNAQLIRGHVEELFWIPMAFSSTDQAIPGAPTATTSNSSLPVSQSKELLLTFPRWPPYLLTKGKVQLLGPWEGSSPPEMYQGSCGHCVAGGPQLLEQRNSDAGYLASGQISQVKGITLSFGTNHKLQGSQVILTLNR